MEIIESIAGYVVKILPYLGVTFTYVMASLIFGTLFALLLAAAKLGRFKAARIIANGYTTLMRCMPSIVLLFLVFYVFPAFFRSWTGSDFRGDAMVFVILTFVLFLGAFMSEVMRAAYQAVSPNQRDAALSHGLTSAQAFWRVILPQAFYFSIPNLGNTVIYLIKDGALAYIVGLIDVMGEAVLLNARSFSVHAIEIYVAVGLIYWALVLIIGKVFKVLEQRFNYQRIRRKAVVV